MATHQIMDASGHTTIEFDKANTVEVGEAMKRFEELTAKGYRYAPRGPDGSAAVKKAFDPNADDAVFIAPMQGG